MTLRRVALLAALVLALFAAKPGDAEAGVYVRIGPGAVYAGPGYGYYYRPHYYYPRAYYYPRYYYPRYYYPRPVYRKKWRKRYWRRYGW